jgi:hypothetical protein
MGHDVLPHRLMPLSLSLLAVAVNYDLPRPARLALKRASGVLAGLAKDRDLKPVDPDRQMPLLVRAGVPSAEDREQIEEARTLLFGDMRTAGLASALGRLDLLPEHASIEGWRWLRAARVVRGPGVKDASRDSFAYFAAIARGFREADRHRPLPARDTAPLRASDLEGLF